MAYYSYYSIDLVLTNAGIVSCGNCKIRKTRDEEYETWNGSPPWSVPLYSPTGFDAKAAFAEAQASPGLEVTLFRLKNGARFYVTSTGSTTWTLWGERDNHIYSLYGGQDYSGANDQFIYVFLGYFDNENGTKYNTIGVTRRNSGGTYNLRFQHPSNWTTYQGYWNVLLSQQPTTLDDPYITQPTDQPVGGYGPGDYTSDEDLPPSLPGVSAAQSGFVSLWNPTLPELKSLSTYIWNDSWWVNQWHHIVANPLDVILSLGIIPFAPATSETKSEVVFGSGGSSGVECYKITDQMYIIPMGSVHITGRSQSYMDYSPYCKASIFLPYCGTYALDVDDIMDADVDLEYHVDIYTGACVAYLTITRTNADGSSVHDVMYQFTGNMLATIPVTGQDHRQFLQSLLFMGASIAATVATAGSAAPAIEGAAAAGDAVAISPALTGVAAGSAINTVMSMKPNVMRSGNLSSNAGMLGKQTPTITMTWSNLCRPDTEYEQVGMPVYKSGTLSDFQGFTVVNSVHMENIYCTETERDMIAQALAKGVIV